jgi:nucleoside-diphosphate kinase
VSVTPYTVALFKPDAVARRLVGAIVTEIEAAGLWPFAIKLARLSALKAGEFYAEHKGRPYFAGLVDFVTSGPLYAVLLRSSSDIDVVARWRELMGPSNPAKRGPQTIRGRWAMSCPEMENLVHGSDSGAAAVREKALLRQWGCL